VFAQQQVAVSVSPARVPSRDAPAAVCGHKNTKWRWLYEFLDGLEFGETWFVARHEMSSREAWRTVHSYNIRTGRGIKSLECDGGTLFIRVCR
jgi:hypothetical protein